MTDQSICGRCGAYRHIHPTKWCAKSRHCFWWDRHYAVRHLAGLAWLALPEKARWWAVGVYYKLRPNLCWCDLVDAAYLDVKADDFRPPYGCGCDVPLPTDAGHPREGYCYCAPRGA